jgi:trimeric autotransporter adhesin
MSKTSKIHMFRSSLLIVIATLIIFSKICVASDVNWSGMGYGPGPDGSVKGSVQFGTDIIVCGDFSSVGGIRSKGIAGWNGSNWYSLAGGTNATVNALAVMGGKLYVGGSFTTVGGINAPYIATWDGTSWATVGNAIGYTVHSLFATSNSLYVGGEFNIAQGSPSDRIAKWDGANWSGLGAGVAGVVYAITGYGSNVFMVHLRDWNEWRCLLAFCHRIKSLCWRIIYRRWRSFL